MYCRILVAARPYPYLATSQQVLIIQIVQDSVDCQISQAFHGVVPENMS